MHKVYFPEIADSYTSFCLFVAGNEVPQLFLSYQLGRPHGQKDHTSFHSYSGKLTF